LRDVHRSQVGNEDVHVILDFLHELGKIRQALKEPLAGAPVTNANIDGLQPWLDALIAKYGQQTGEVGLRMVWQVTP
jgi:hypothetical protein